MATKPESGRNRALRLGRSSLTGQFVLKPVGTPSRNTNAIGNSGIGFSGTERRILHLAARRISNGDIAKQLNLTEMMVKKALDKAKAQYSATNRIDAARRYVNGSAVSVAQGSLPS